MCTYLHTRGRRYYFRRAVPSDLAPFIRTATGQPRLEWMISLGTSDRITAKRLIPDHTIHTEALLDEARAKATAAATPLATFVGRKRSRFAPNYDGPTPEEQEVMAVFESAAQQREWRYEAREDARRLLKQRFRGTTANLSEPEAAARDLVREAMEDAELSRQQLTVARYDLAEARNANADAALVAAIIPAAHPDAAIMALFEGYIAERKPSASTIRNWRPVMAHLISYLGHDDASRISSRDLIRWKDKLQTERTPRGTLRSARTVSDGYVAAIKVVLGWASENEHIPSNPALTVKVRVPKAVRLRDPGFTDAEALLILAAALEPATGSISDEHRLARRWVPWLCAYTGARVNEISQLRRKDVAEIDGIWTIRITPEAGSTKNNTARVVPLHPHLVEQGFTAFARAKDDLPIFYSPSRQRTGTDDSRHYKKVGERLATWVRSLGISDLTVQPNHGWRHRFKTAARRCGMDHTAMDVIQGHAAKSEGDKYGSYPLETLATELAKLPRFDV